MKKFIITNLLLLTLLSLPSTVSALTGYRTYTNYNLYSACYNMQKKPTINIYQIMLKNSLTQIKQHFGQQMETQKRFQEHMISKYIQIKQ